MSYSQWLRLIVDLSDKPSAEFVGFLSGFDGLAYKNCDSLVQYAQYWCVLSDFLYRNRAKQLCSDVEMLFVIEERGEKTDVYWFEVARACDVAGKEAIQTIVQRLGILPVLDAKVGYAETGLSLSKQVLSDALDLIKKVVGLCHYTLVTATATCKYFQMAPDLMNSIKRRYVSLRVIGCWIVGMLALRFPLEGPADQPTECDMFDACFELASREKETLIAAASLLSESCPLLKSYAFVVKSIAEGQKGCAKGFAKQCEKHAAKNGTLIARIQAMTQFADVLPPPIVPAENSPLLKIPCAKKPHAPLTKGINPLSQGTTLKCRE